LQLSPRADQIGELFSFDTAFGERSAPGMSRMTQRSTSHRARQPRVLVSVLNYKAVDDTVATVQSLRRQDYENFHLQIVDNASPSDCVERIRAQLPDVEIRVTENNLGYCGGNNYALRQGFSEGYDYVLVCNEDIEVEPTAIRHLVETAEAHSDAGVVGAVEVCHFTDQVRAVRGDTFSFWTGRGVWSTHLPKDDKPLRTTFVQGALVLFARRALEAGVFMNEGLFMYLDEADLGFQLARAGLGAYVDPRVVVRHKNKVKFYNARSGYLHQRNRVLMVRQYGKWYHQVAFHAGVALFQLPAKLALRAAHGRAHVARSGVLGYVDGIAGRMGPGRVSTL
jgi:GT2 family glycosyltransferase